MTDAATPVRAVLALGGNLGDRLARLQRAVDLLASAGTVVAVSPVYETAPVGGPPQPDYLNAVVLLDTSLSAHTLLARCHDIEDDLGRERRERWGPRAIDVDVIAYGDAVLDEPDLVLPHPRAYERAFVLVPWADVDPSVAGRVAELDVSGVRRAPGTLQLPAGRE